MGRVLAVSGVTLLVFIASSLGCGSQSPAPRTAAEYEMPPAPPVRLEVDEPFFIPGEEMSWELSLRGILGGKADMAMGHPGFVDGKHVIIVRSRVRSAGIAVLIKEINDDIMSWIDLDSSLPQRHAGRLKFGNKQTTVDTKFFDQKYVIDYERTGRPNGRRVQHMPVGEVVHDGHSILGVLRAWLPEDGAQAYFFVLSGRRLWHNTIKFVGRETIKTKMGTYPAIKLEGVGIRMNFMLRPDLRKGPRRYTVWISDDANRAPLLVTARTEYGEVRVELVHYDRPDRRIVKR